MSAYIVKLNTERDEANRRDLVDFARDLAREKAPSMTVTICTKKYPATRFDPPEYEEEETIVDYEDMSSSVEDDLVDQIIDVCMDELAYDGVYNSKDAWLLDIQSKMNDNVWSRILDNWESVAYDKVQEFAQDRFVENQMNED